jgi:hypothetical protein
MALLFRSSVDAEARWKPQLKGLGVRSRPMGASIKKS